MGALAYDRLRWRREDVEAQIAAAFPARGADWARTVARRSYMHFGAEAAVLLGDGAAEGDLVERTAGRAELLELYGKATAAAARRAAAARPGDGGPESRGPDDGGPGTRGAVVVTGHLGNWELGGACLASLGIPVTAVVKGMRNARLGRRVEALRRRLGIQPLYMEDAARGAAHALRAGRAVVLVADQDARGRGVFVPFLDRPAATFRGPAALALACRVPLLFGACVREGEGYRITLEEVPAPAPGRGAVAELTARWVRRLEEHVRRRPEQYFWFHRRWKTQPVDSHGARRRIRPATAIPERAHRHTGMSTSPAIAKGRNAIARQTGDTVEGPSAG